ncbi:uncharacterized protein BDW70DRAFT_136785 [Aspergillus foveolatus]|uniref:uncharacterized protein n=1 Tax=Aspergillus foveolatus TaxID=210207 RepID=UPI003CCD612F
MYNQVRRVSVGLCLVDSTVVPAVIVTGCIVLPTRRAVTEVSYRSNPANLKTRRRGENEAARQ